MVQLGVFLCRLLVPLLKIAFSLIGNETKSLAKSVLLPLGSTARSSVTDANIQNKIFGSGKTALTISTKEMDDIMKIVKSFEESDWLIKCVKGTIKN